MTERTIPRILPAVAMARLRRLILDAGYAMETAIRRIGLHPYRTCALDDGAAARAIRDYLEHPVADATDLLGRFFLLGIPVARRLLLKNLPSEAIALLAATGLLEEDGSLCRVPFSIWECEGLLIAADSFADPPPSRGVMPLFPESYELAAALPRRPLDNALDLCTGSGVHALLASRHAARATGIDINPRAVAFARFNAALNGIGNIRFLAGDLYAAVPGERFDLILANPPYLPANGTDPGENWYAGGERGDAVSSRILDGLKVHLAPGGLCQMIHLMAGEAPRPAAGMDGLQVLVLSDPYTPPIPLPEAAPAHFGITAIRLAPPGEASFCRHLPFTLPVPELAADFFRVGRVADAYSFSHASSFPERSAPCE